VAGTLLPRVYRSRQHGILASPRQEEDKKKKGRGTTMPQQTTATKKNHRNRSLIFHKVLSGRQLFVVRASCISLLMIVLFHRLEIAFIIGCVFVAAPTAGVNH
jgi:hypothetical protein